DRHRVVSVLEQPERESAVLIFVAGVVRADDEHRRVLLVGELLEFAVVGHVDHRYARARERGHLAPPLEDRSRGLLVTESHEDRVHPTPPPCSATHPSATPGLADVTSTAGRRGGAPVASVDVSRDDRGVVTVTVDNQSRKNA